MLHQHYQFGCSQAAFDVRSNPNVTQSFREIFRTDKLTSSVDGVAFGLAPEITNRGWENKGWLHLDQALSRNNFECVQGWVTAEDIGEGDGTLRVLRGSHLFHEEFATTFSLQDHKSDWFKLTEEHVDWYVRKKGCAIVDIQCEAGSQVLWESRTVHSGRSPVRGRENAARCRYVIYTSYLPSNQINQQGIKKKKKAVSEGRMTSHWADGRKLFSKSPRTYGQPEIEMPEYEPPRLTRLGAELFGWHDDVDSCPFLVGTRKRTRKSPWDKSEVVEQENVSEENESGASSGGGAGGRKQLKCATKSGGEN